MTDTTPMAPTDAEIEALGHRMCWRYKHSADPHHSSTYTFNRTTLLDFSRAVLTRWGQPAQAAEPVAWAFKYDDGTWHDPSTTEHSSGMRPLFEAPHPVACEPLIRQMRDALALPCDRWNATQSRIVREAIDAADAWLEGKK